MFGVYGFDVFDYTNVTIARDAFVVGTEIGFDDSAFAARFYDQEFFGHVYLDVEREMCVNFFVRQSKYYKVRQNISQKDLTHLTLKIDLNSCLLTI